MAADREKVIKGLEMCIADDTCDECPYREPCFGQTYAVQMMRDALELLKEQEAIKQKMWNALYAEEDECEKKYSQTDKHNEWFMVYRPWLQRGFEIAIKVIAEQE